MKKNQLGKSDLNVSEVGFGCMSLGENHAYNKALLWKAFDRGINFFDTADLYDKGLNEMQVGTALRDFRQQIVLATKVGNQWRADGQAWDWNPSKSYILKAADQSLKRLKTDYIDLYQLHGGTIDDPIDETIEAFEMLKEQGKIRWYGISSIRPNVIETYVKRSSMVSVMMQYSLLDQRPEEAMLKLLDENNIAVIARGSLAQGRLLGKKAGPYLQYTESEVQRLYKTIEKISAAKQVSSLAIALAYVLHRSAVRTAVVGIRTEEQLDDLFDLPTSIRLSDAEVAPLKDSIRKFYYQEHRT